MLFSIIWASAGPQISLHFQDFSIKSYKSIF